MPSDTIQSYASGGSVMFIHRYVLEYFADEWERHYDDELGY